MINEFSLTKTEKTVYKLLLQGFNAKEISEKLFVTKATVKTHMNNIFKKTGTHSVHKLLAKELLIMKGQKDKKIRNKNNLALLDKEEANTTKLVNKVLKQIIQKCEENK